MASNRCVVYSVPWDVTTTFGVGTASAPLAIQAVYHQLDDSHPFQSAAPVIEFCSVNPTILQFQDIWAPVSRPIIAALNRGDTLTPDQDLQRQGINQASIQLQETVFLDTLLRIRRAEPLLLCGGEHGVGVGYVQALSSVYPSISVLHIDAHLDARPNYFGYTHSHASVMTHYADTPSVKHITSVGIRDYDPSEPLFMHEHSVGSDIFYDYEMHHQLFSGDSWASIVHDILDTLKHPVFISLDVDGLMPSLCPNTGTPVPGGLNYNQLVYLFEQLSRQKSVIGAELVEVNSPSGTVYDATVGARLIQLMAGILS
ncbi:MAG: arginase family protein [Candidatus Marinamargulisbacteria bacterium]